MATRLHIKNLKVGMVIDSYDAMCDLLGDKNIPSDDMSKRSSQYKKWRKYFNFSRNKHFGFEITEIYNTSKSDILTDRDLHGGFELWCELYEFVEHQILGLSSDSKMPRHCILRLEGLSKGNFVANNTIKPLASYQYIDMLTSFKLAKALMKGKRFADNGHRFNFAMTIVEKKINDVVMSRERLNKTSERIETINVEAFENNKAEYKTKSEKTKNNVMNSLW